MQRRCALVARCLRLLIAALQSGGWFSLPDRAWLPGQGGCSGHDSDRPYKTGPPGPQQQAAGLLRYFSEYVAALRTRLPDLRLAP